VGQNLLEIVQLWVGVYESFQPRVATRNTTGPVGLSGGLADSEADQHQAHEAF
jgi:hypothetical protein